jgi:hypothetical protein
VRQQLDDSVDGMQGGAREHITERANGSTALRLHMATKLSGTAAVLPPRSLLKNVPFCVRSARPGWPAHHVHGLGGSNPSEGSALIETEALSCCCVQKSVQN